MEFVSSHCYRVSWATLSYQQILQYRVQWRKAGVSHHTTASRVVLPILWVLALRQFRFCRVILVALGWCTWLACC